MKHSTGKPSKAEAARMSAIKDGECLCCWIDGNPSYCPEVHHLISGNRRRGHMCTIGLCAWHHRAVIEQLPRSQMRALYGPSLAEGSKPFNARYGSDDELLAMQNSKLKPIDQSA